MSAQEEVNKVFGDPFDTEVDERVKKASSGYTKIEDGETVRLRATLNLYRYYTIKPEGAIMPLKNNDVKELLSERSIDEIIEDQTFAVNERYAVIVWNYEKDQPEVWQISRTLFEDLRTLHRDPDWEGGIQDNDIKVTRKGKKTDTKYTVNFARKSEKLTDEQQARLLDIDVQAMVAGATKL